MEGLDPRPIIKEISQMGTNRLYRAQINDPISKTTQCILLSLPSSNTLLLHCQKPEIGWAIVVVQFTKSELLFFSFFPFWENEIKTIFRSPEDSSGIALHEQSSQTISSCKIK